MTTLQKLLIKENITRNKKLIEEYPFLLPRNVWTDKPLEDYDYSWTLLDNIPEGWREAFGLQLCKELKQALEKDNYLDKFRFTQIKEKYGVLCLYTNGAPRRTFDILDKYELMSEYYCYFCGKEAYAMTDGYILPVCKKCYEANKDI